MIHFNSILPTAESLPDILNLKSCEDLSELLSKSLMNPLFDFFQRPGKNIRSTLVELGYRLSLPEEPELSDEIKEKLRFASAIVELIHGGSLIIDDIQDGSTVRRNSATLHLKHGMPLALNAGNWLYFWALDSIRKLDLPPATSTSLLNDLLNLMIKAHFGQALDIGTKIDEVRFEKVKATSLATMELKTGTLLILALRLGMGIANTECTNANIIELGKKLGISLQMFDDFGNLHQPIVVGPTKRHEDLRNRRPSWAWAVAAELGKMPYQDFIKAVEQLPEETSLNKWMIDHNFIHLMQISTSEYLNELSQEWTGLWEKSHPESFLLLQNLKAQLENSYVS